MTPKTKSVREQMDKQEFIKINNYCPSKDTVKKERKKTISHEEGEIIAKHISNKGFESRIYKEANSRAESCNKEQCLSYYTQQIFYQGFLNPVYNY